MSNTTKIQWTDSTWNVVTGCSRVSPGCANCYIERTPPFRIGHRRFATVDGKSTTGLQLHPERLEKIPRGPLIFVCSLADLFHDEVPLAYLDEVFGAIAADYLAGGQRKFQILTKRPEHMRSYLRSETAQIAIAKRAIERADVPGVTSLPWPLPNVWAGVSVENARFTHRADVLRDTPAAVRFISAEPLLGSLCRPKQGSQKPLDLTGIDWLIVGGESGPGARPMQLDWARELVDLALANGTEPFVKQLGSMPRVSREELATTCAVPVECEHGYDVCPTCDAGDAKLELHDRQGGDWDEWPADLRVRLMPQPLTEIFRAA